MTKNKNLNFVVIFILLFFLSACSVREKLEDWDKQAGELFFASTSTDSIVDDFLKDQENDFEAEQDGVTKSVVDWRDLSQAQKVTVDE